MTYTIASPIPDIQDITSIGGNPITEGVNMARTAVVGWKDGSNYAHIFACVGGFTNANWNAHYVNTNTNAGYMLPDLAPGAVWDAAYSPSANKLYILSNYSGSLTEFNPVTGDTVIISTTCGSAGQVKVGTDNKIYLVTSGLAQNHVWSYDPAVGLSSWFDYGGIPNTDGDQNNINGLAADGNNIFVAMRKTNSAWTMFSCPVGSTTWTEWEFGGSGDLGVFVGMNADTDPDSWCVQRRLSDNSYITYYLDNIAPKYHWLSDTTFNQPSMINSPTHCVFLDSLEDTFGRFADQVGYDLDFSQGFAPVKTVHEESNMAYAVHNSGSWSYSNLSFTGPWYTQTIRHVLPQTGDTLFCLSQDYNASFYLDYSDRTRTYIGGEILGPYILSRHQISGEYYSGGYSNFVWRYDPNAEWTLDNTNSTPIDTGGVPGQGGRPNPYRIDLPGTIYHYRHGIAFDANGLVWIGGNTTRLEPDYGNVGWYDPSDGTTGYLYDWTSGILFRSICSCLNGSKILVFSNDNILHRIDADNQSDDNVDITNTGGYGYMIETSYDRVFVVHFSAGPTYKVGILKPSDMTWVVALSSTPLSGLGAPFGFPESLYLRMYRKLELGPDGYVWMQVGTTIYRIDPTQDPLIFEDIADVGTSASLKFANNSTDLILYNLNANADSGNTDVKYIQGIFTYASDYSRGSYILLPTDDAELETPYTGDDITDVANDDTDMVAQLATSQIAVHQFKQQINGIGGIIYTVAQVTIPCSTSTTYLQIYNRSGTPAWDTVDSDNATGANTDFTLSATVADLTDYKDENNIVACRVYQEMQ